MVSLPVLNPLTGINRVVRHVRADAEPQRHGGDGRPDAASTTTSPPSTCSTSARRTTPTRCRTRTRRTGRGSQACTASSSTWATRTPRRPEQFFDQEQLDELRQRQIDAVTYLDENVFPKLFDKLPPETWLVVTADHGELFGEEGFFGHGPVQHPKVTEVPFVEGLARLGLQRVFAVEVELHLDHLVAVEAEDAGGLVLHLDAVALRDAAQADQRDHRVPAFDHVVVVDAVALPRLEPVGPDLAKALWALRALAPASRATMFTVASSRTSPPVSISAPAARRRRPGPSRRAA